MRRNRGSFVLEHVTHVGKAVHQCFLRHVSVNLFILGNLRFFSHEKEKKGKKKNSNTKNL